MNLKEELKQGQRLNSQPPAKSDDQGWDMFNIFSKPEIFDDITPMFSMFNFLCSTDRDKDSNEDALKKKSSANNNDNND